MMSSEDSKRKINVIALRVILHKVSKMNGTATERVLFESKGVKEKKNTVHPSATAAPVCYITGDQWQKLQELMRWPSIWVITMENWNVSLQKY